jgi:hypothetical protein
MRFLRRLLARLANFVKNPEDDGRLREEMEEHLARQTERPWRVCQARASVVEKGRTAWARKHPRGSLGYARDRLFDSAPSSAVSGDDL